MRKRNSKARPGNTEYMSKNQRTREREKERRRGGHMRMRRGSTTRLVESTGSLGGNLNQSVSCDRLDQIPLVELQLHSREIDSHKHFGWYSKKWEVLQVAS